MNKLKFIAVFFCLMVSVGMAVAQTNLSVDTTAPDKHERAMQSMMYKLLQASSQNFSLIKGREVSRRNNSVFYTANLVNLVTDSSEMRKALATDFFGAMQTTEDNIVETPEGTIYLARYKDDEEFSITTMVTNAFTGMPRFLGIKDLSKGIEKLQGRTADETIYILQFNNQPSARLTVDTKNGTATLIIGQRK